MNIFNIKRECNIHNPFWPVTMMNIMKHQNIMRSQLRKPRGKTAGQHPTFKALLSMVTSL